MSARVLHFRNLSERERQVLLYIRADEGETAFSGRLPPFAALNRTARALGLVVGEPASPFVHTDEKRLLSWLSLAQRGKLERSSPLMCVLADVLFECSGFLKATDCHLDHRTTVWFDSAAANVERATFAQHSNVAIQSLHSRIIQYVTQQGMAATSELNAMGASRQVVSTMRKKGALRRIRHGLYTVGNLDRASAAQAAST